MMHSLDAQLSALHAEMRTCRRCLEAGYPITPGAVFSGPSTAEVMVVGQAPGITETQVGRPFNGPSGRRLFQWLAQAGWDEDEFRATQYMSAVTKCYPGKSSGGKGDRAPTRGEQKLCASFLEQELAIVRPQIVIPVGGLAVRRFLGSVKLAHVVGRIMRSDDEQHENGKDYWIVPLPHPSGASLWLNRAENRERVDRALAHLDRLYQELRASRDQDP